MGPHVTNRSKFPGRIIAVDHGSPWDEKGPAADVLPQFKQYVKPGAKLFIEDSPEHIRRYLSGWKTGFVPLIRYANRGGMKIVPLEKNNAYKVRDAIGSRTGRRAELDEHHGVAEAAGFTQVGELRMAAWMYRDLQFREVPWIPKLMREAREGGLVIMHPGHAQGIAQKAGITPRDVVWLHPYKTRFPGVSDAKTEN